MSIRSCLLGFLLSVWTAVATAQESAVTRGEDLTAAGGCVSCHTKRKGVPFAGGRPLESEFGIFYSPNITPDRTTGIGDWTEEEFLNAFWKGVAPDGSHYFPAFPYTAYTGVAEQDLLDIRAYLMSLEPVNEPNMDHELPWYLSQRLIMAVWKLLFFDEERFSPSPEKTDAWNRGAYLVRHLGHCGECHTPRGQLGQLMADQEMAGASLGSDGEKVPNITPHPEDGIGRWSSEDLIFFLEIGMTPESDFAGSSMAAVIEKNTGVLSDQDRAAISTYLMSLDAIAKPAEPEGGGE